MIRKTHPQGGVGAIAVLLIIFGCMTVVMNIISFALPLHDLKLLHVAMGIVCGAVSLSAGIMIWRNSRSARRGYIVFCIAIILYWAFVLGPLTLYAVPGYAIALFLLFAGFRYISQNRRVA